MKILHVRIALIFCAVILATFFFLTRREDSQALAAPISDVASALASSAELPDFKEYELKAEPKGKYVWANRKADGMRLRITVVALPSAAEAQKICDTLTYPPGGRMPETSPSGRIIGQKVWMSQYPKGKQPEDAFTLVVLDGRTVTVIQMLLQIGKDQRGFAVSRKFAPADLTFAETMAIGRVTKLAAMGLTSGGPAVQPGNAKK